MSTNLFTALSPIMLSGHDCEMHRAWFNRIPWFVHSCLCGHWKVCLICHTALSPRIRSFIHRSWKWEIPATISEKEITQLLKSVFNTWSDLQEVWELDWCLKTKREICSTQRNLSLWIYPPNVMGCKQDKRSHTYHLGWLFEKQWVCLPGWCCKLELVTKKDSYVIFHRRRKYMSQLNFCEYIVHICWR